MLFRNEIKHVETFAFIDNYLICKTRYYQMAYIFCMEDLEMKRKRVKKIDHPKRGCERDEIKSRQPSKRDRTLKICILSAQIFQNKIKTDVTVMLQYSH